MCRRNDVHRPAAVANALSATTGAGTDRMVPDLTTENRDSVRSDLGTALENLCNAYDESALDPDPLFVVREFSDPRDQEIAAFFSALFAYGNARIIARNLRDLFSRMPGGPYGFVTASHLSSGARCLTGWQHRLHTGEDVAIMSSILAHVLRRHGSLERVFCRGLRKGARDVGVALEAFVPFLREQERHEVERRRFFRHLLPSPADGSACKRLNLFLRWVVRRESPDLGLWRTVSPSLLVLPLDTHVARICKQIGLTRRSTVDWKMAVEVTRKLRHFDPADPIRFDYALSRLGILGHCPLKTDINNCSRCPLHISCVIFRERGLS
ncbi:MAG: hypothetical protein BWY06_00827 [Candidatus Latescibacteria bacterium ADurb.Bin168]|nr:MAG: hypothetical protein BWY06_00827 [Candidatus Latescibacteria bacterium ADurb.Bin168]